VNVEQIPGSDAERRRAEEAARPGQYDRAAQRNPVTYGGPASPVSGAAMRRLVRPSGSVGDVNTMGVASYGLLPDLIQDARNSGGRGAISARW
jgi:hypothetical protein